MELFPHQFRLIVGLLCLLIAIVVGEGVYLSNQVQQAKHYAAAAGDTAQEAADNAEAARSEAEEAAGRADDAATKLGQ